ncbi:MAG TPA: NAD-binding protein [Sporichthyaceae bacterium]|nr:NAD-binding protein [Sporichthyaceae bacterium]
MLTDCRAKTGHVIVCGLDGVALRTIEQLHLAGVSVVVVAEGSQTRGHQNLSRWGIPVITGSARVRETLAAAGLAGAVAVVCVQDNDLQTLETALLVLRLRPDVRLVVQLANVGVGRALSELTGPGTVLDVASLSAPSVVEACLRRTEHRLEVEGTSFIAAELTVDQDGSLRELFGDLAPIAVVGHGGGDMVICPGRDHVVAAGDRVAVVGTEADLAAGRGPRRPVVVADRSREGRLRRAWGAVGRLARTLAGEADRSIGITLGVLAGVFGIAVIVLLIGYRKPDGRHMNLVDAIYFTVETIGTIGYGDFSFAAQAQWLRVFAIALMILGATLVTMLFALLTNLLISRRIAESLGRRNLGRMRGHVVVVGLGSVGMRVVEGLLAQSRTVVVLDRDEDNRYLAQARALGVPVVIADATQPATLHTVGLAKAAAVAVLTSDELINIETGLAMRDQLGERWREVPVVLRVFDAALAETVETSLGFRFVRSASALAAPWFVGAALGLDVLGTFYVDRMPFLMARLTVAADGGLDGLAMQELSARTRVVAINRAGSSAGQLEYPPRSGTRFEAGDRAYIVGPYEELLQVLRRDALSASQLPTPPPRRTASTEGLRGG